MTLQNFTELYASHTFTKIPANLLSFGQKSQKSQKMINPLDLVRGLERAHPNPKREKLTTRRERRLEARNKKKIGRPSMLF